MPKITPRTIANRLRKAVTDSRMTVNAVAVKSGVPQPVLYRFMRGERDLTLTTAQKLADYFGLEMQLTKKTQD